MKKEEIRMTLSLCNYIDAQLSDNVPILAVIKAIETLHRHVETLYRSGICQKDSDLEH